jgi:hypothetical protein
MGSKELAFELIVRNARTLVIVQSTTNAKYE